jgi:hypothetical protein
MDTKTTIGAIIGTVLIGGVLVAYTEVDRQAVEQLDDVPVLEEKKDGYKKPDYNLESVRFESIRKEIDVRYQVAHDTLSEAYYEQEPFVWEGVDYGILTKAEFDAFQGMIWSQYVILFHETNKSKPLAEQIPEEEYNKELVATTTESGAVEKIKVDKDKRADELLKEYKKYVPEITI